MKTSELIGPALDWAVAKCLTGGELFQCGRVAHKWVLHCVGGVTAPYFMKDSGVVRCAFEPSTSWCHGGPIIERECINAYASGACSVAPKNPDYWVAEILGTDEMLTQYGPTPLIAAMRCFVTSKLGDEAEIPEELK